MDNNIIFLYKCFSNPGWNIKQKENIIITENYIAWQNHIIESHYYIVNGCIKSDSMNPVKAVRKTNG